MKFAPRGIESCLRAFWQLQIGAIGLRRMERMKLALRSEDAVLVFLMLTPPGVWPVSAHQEELG
jgi:hypothetical protein